MVKLLVTTHSGSEDEIEVKRYNAEEIAEKLNDNDVHSIVLGDNVYSRIDLKNIKPI